MKNEGNNRIADRDYFEHVDGDVVVERSRPFMRHDDPNIVDCPYGCGERTWWNATECWNCRRPVFQYFQNLTRKAKKEKFERICLFSFLIGFGLFILGGQLPEEYRLFGFVPGVFCFVIACLFGKESDRL